MYKLSPINFPHNPSLSGLCYVNVETLGLLNKINTSNYICVLARVAGIPKISVHTRLWKRARRTDELSAGVWFASSSRRPPRHLAAGLGVSRRRRGASCRGCGLARSWLVVEEAPGSTGPGLCPPLDVVLAHMLARGVS